MAEVKVQEEHRSGLGAGLESTGIEAAEPWEPWETKLVWYSIVIGVAALVIGGYLVNRYLLS